MEQCGHTFHQHCLNQWAGGKTLCTHCRTLEVQKNVNAHTQRVNWLSRLEQLVESHEPQFTRLEQRAWGNEFQLGRLMESLVAGKSLSPQPQQFWRHEDLLDSLENMNRRQPSLWAEELLNRQHWVRRLEELASRHEDWLQRKELRNQCEAAVSTRRRTPR
jgi:hypothetical protein